MADAQTYTVRFEPVGIEMDIEEGETVLDAAFRQGIAVMHGCKEGQCSSCKSRLMEGDIELKRYSTFALPDYERETDHILLCRTHAYSDLVVELLNYDEELMRRSIPVREFNAEVAGIEQLTHDIRLLRLSLAAPLRFWAGQYVDITLPQDGITRSFSMANPPEADGTTDLAFIIKRYPDGAFSSRLDGGIAAGDRVTVKGPYGTCFRREGKSGPLLLIGGGSGMSPLWSMLQDHIRSGESRPVRFFYGARTVADLFYLDAFRTMEKEVADFRFIPALSHHDGSQPWSGETGFVHEVVARTLMAEGLEGEMDAYACGPPPMIDAVLPVLQMAGLEPENINFDKFTPATR
ncbi:NADH:ubiquinone reductase (Na(+)-transporting) subunit F [Acidisphaera rubrifaciens]|uniref:Oxidoreductase FAD/NAD(P)-binding subunit n=1 Tax=Acidisphaera rubrifaciens HS-AP3 TaxID=1231350 RepID=A0A0D6PAQ8_9PROT|nr:2Fe-2S iron-sulfur cluster binding domain-containing protein [Acidisphaera rubrifaciens]GAN77959.1 oxidoreductase FAD/NAD(P)-binding subunit [Acidisphaera rubrifaciens HS-AP3]